MKKALFFFFMITLVGNLLAHDFYMGGKYYKIASQPYNGNHGQVYLTYQGTSPTQYANEYSGSVSIPSMVSYNGNIYG